MSYLFSLEEILHNKARLTQKHLDALDPLSYAAIVDQVNDWYQTRRFLKDALKIHGDNLKPLIEKQKEYFKSKMRFENAVRVDFTLTVLNQLLEEFNYENHD